MPSTAANTREPFEDVLVALENETTVLELYMSFATMSLPSKLGVGDLSADVEFPWSETPREQSADEASGSPMEHAQQTTACTEIDDYDLNDGEHKTTLGAEVGASSEDTVRAIEDHLRGLASRLEEIAGIQCEYISVQG